jgi:hypothetical protein
LASFIASPDWLLAGFDAATERFHFAQIDRDTYSRSSFLDHRIEPRPASVRSASAAEVDQFLEKHEPAPAAYVFHTAFCASTLLASCLDHAPHSLVLKEPLVLSKLAGLKREQASATDGAWPALARRVLGLTDRSYQGETVIVKPSNFANALIPDLLGTESEQPAPRRKFLLMSSSLPSLLISILKKRDEAQRSLPGFLRALLADSDYRDRVPPFSLQSLDLLQQSVIFWHCQRYQFQGIVQRFGEEACLRITMEEFLSSPLESLHSICAGLGLALEPGILEHTVSRGAFNQHSKDPASAYSPGKQRKEARRTAKRHEAEIDQALEWGRPFIEAFPADNLFENPDSAYFSSR